ncbi:unnamed protein product [Sphenostylis stenocarpa]|uniref:Adenosine deaminase domain-containing protein n=1 Tax=Sphenostylis stenocarpa TaxID=92480 RepID=A0AA86T3Z7_9FABA|nr:unnamed protein product [Sphenostylis stenocarpa]
MEWCVSMPKVELHAHLNGSIRDSTLLDLTEGLIGTGVIDISEVEHIIKKYNRSVAEVFKLFDLIHILTTDHNTVTRITKEVWLLGCHVVEDFASDNVVYLELRTTPKRNDSAGMSKRSYVEAVLKGLRSITSVDVDFIPHCADSKSLFTPLPGIGHVRKRIYVRLLLSIDRRETAEAAMETVKLALEMKPFGVIGIDLSGHPCIGDWTTYLPALKFAREQGLYVTLHCGEVPNSKEIKNMLDFRPQRIGHACHLEDEHWRQLKSSKIPVEICLTSNIRTLTIRSIHVHHFELYTKIYPGIHLKNIFSEPDDLVDAGDLYKAKHPIVLCTDDSGVFSTSLSKEYKFAADSFGRFHFTFAASNLN